MKMYIFNLESLPKSLDRNIQLVIGKETLNLLHTMHNQEILNDEYIETYNHIKLMEKYAEEKRSRTGSTILGFPSRDMLRKKIERQYLAAYGGNYKSLSL